MHTDLPYVIAGVSSLIGREISIDEWAERYPVPNRKQAGTKLSGADVRRIVGLEGKSWDPVLFADFGNIVCVAREALAAAQIAPAEIGAVLLVTATPYQVMLDLDSFRLLRELGIPDHVPPLQLGAGCAGMARAMSLAARHVADAILIVTYEVSSLYMESELYRANSTHPLADALWMSPALFSDGAAAVVLRRDAQATGFVTYSRDSLAFGAGPGFADPLIHYPGGGGLHPPGTRGSEELSCYGMAGEKTREYYGKGMALNHAALKQRCPDYLDQVARIYVHQANPRLVDGLIEYLVNECGADREKLVTHARRFGNLVSPSTVKLLHDDLKAGAVKSGQQICVSVVGAGPERGAYLAALA